MRYIVLLFLICHLNAAFAGIENENKYIKRADAYAEKFKSRVGSVQLSSDGGSNIKACSDDSGKCVVGKLLKALGRVKKIVQGNFVVRASASWLAISDKRTHLCAIAEGATRTSCAIVSKSSFPEIEINFVGINSKTDRAADDSYEITFRADPKSSKLLFYAHTVAFMRGYSDAQTRLRAMIDGGTAGRAVTMNATIRHVILIRQCLSQSPNRRQRTTLADRLKVVDLAFGMLVNGK